jgi:hypothetical protein
MQRYKTIVNMLVGYKLWMLYVNVGFFLGR